MAHLSTFILLSHAQQKSERCSVGRDSPQADRERADDNVRRIGDKIEMAQYIRGRIGEDRGTILDMGRIPDYHTRFPAPSALSQRQKSDPDTPPFSPVTEDDEPVKPARDEPVEPAPKRPRSASTVTDSRSFSPMTGSDQDSPVSGIKTEAQADDLIMAKVTSKLTHCQGTT